MPDTILIMGLPGAGKTTFLAALWHVVRTEKVDGAMRLVRLPRTREYLNRIGELWERCTEQRHTVAGSEVTVSLDLEDPRTARTAEIIFPDLSGESYESQWSHRQWTLHYNDLATRAAGVLVFVHADQRHDAQTIGELTELAGVLHVNGGTESADVVQSVPAPWEDSFAPPQVKLVDLLQFLAFDPISRVRFPVTVVVSAWDRIKASGLNLSPAAWLKEHLPLLDQFLTANGDIFVPDVLGVSATGGDLQAERDKLLEEDEPWRRIQIVRANGEPASNPHDLTLLVREMLGRSLS